MPILQILSTILQVIPLVQAILHIPWFTVARTGIPSFVINSPLFYSCTFQYIRCVAHLCIESRKTFILFRFLSLRMRYLLTFGLWGVEMIFLAARDIKQRLAETDSKANVRFVFPHLQLGKHRAILQI